MPLLPALPSCLEPLGPSARATWVLPLPLSQDLAGVPAVEAKCCKAAQAAQVPW